MHPVTLAVLLFLLLRLQMAKGFFACPSSKCRSGCLQFLHGSTQRLGQTILQGHLDCPHTQPLFRTTIITMSSFIQYIGIFKVGLLRKITSLLPLSNLDHQSPSKQ
jgi:hypothetical protein